MSEYALQSISHRNINEANCSVEFRIRVMKIGGLNVVISQPKGWIHVGKTAFDIYALETNCWTDSYVNNSSR